MNISYLTKIAIFSVIHPLEISLHNLKPYEAFVLSLQMSQCVNIAHLYVSVNEY